MQLCSSWLQIVGDAVVVVVAGAAVAAIRYAELTPGRCIAHRYTWKDAAGNVVATGMDDTDVDGTSDLVMNISCAATSEVAACQQPTLPPRPDRCCGLSVFGGAVCAGGVLEPSCEAGTCP